MKRAKLVRFGRVDQGPCLKSLSVRRKRRRARGLAVIVSGANPGARRLYERLGYKKRAARPMVKEDWANDGMNWLLLVKDA